MIDTKFGILFTVELLHKYFADGQCDDFSIAISQQTTQVLKGNKIIARQYDNKLYVGLPEDATGKPLSALPGGLQLTFFMQLSSPLFFNYTNIPFSWPSGKIYYFTNRNNNSAGSKNFLSQFLSYDNAKTYAPGDVVTDGAGTVFQSIQTSTGVAPSLVNSAFWVKVDTSQYVSEADALQWMPSISTYNFPVPKTSVTVDVLGYNAAAHDYSTNVLSQKIAFAKPTQSFTLDISALPPGKYNLSIDGGTGKWIYLNNELANVNALAVIDIFNDAGMPSNYSFLTGTGTLASPEYSILFLNRYTIWKYVLASGAAGTIVDNAGVYKFSPAASTILSLTPVPLSEKALNLKLTVNAIDYTPISCPSPQRLVTVKPAADIYSCSEIYLNY